MQFWIASFRSCMLQRTCCKTQYCCRVENEQQLRASAEERALQAIRKCKAYKKRMNSAAEELHAKAEQEHDISDIKERCRDLQMR